jgi:hypothetical protein
MLRQPNHITNIQYTNYDPAGVELEEAGEKWRAGDAAKSMRFFMRAITNYDEGLQKHPGTFDLAYNKYVSWKNSSFCIC